MMTTPAKSADQDFLFRGGVTQNCDSTNLRSHLGSRISDSRLTWPSGLSGFPGLLLGIASGADARRELVKALRKAAKDCGLPSEQLPRDTASRDKVQELARKAAAILAQYFPTPDLLGLLGFLAFLGFCLRWLLEPTLGGNW